MSGGSQKKMLTLRSSDGKLFEIEEAAAALSETIRNLIEDRLVDEAVTLPNVNGHILAKVTEYCRKHAETDAMIRDETLPECNVGNDPAGVGVAERLRRELNEWDAAFIGELNQEQRFGLVLAANYLCIRSLLDLACRNVADSIKDMMPEEVRELFGIECDYTPEEEAAIRKENEWAFTIQKK